MEWRKYVAVMGEADFVVKVSRENISVEILVMRSVIEMGVRDL